MLLFKRVALYNTLREQVFHGEKWQQDAILSLVPCYYDIQTVVEMKMKIVIMMVLLLAVVGAKAQEVENPVGRFSVIPRIGVSLANWSGLVLEPEEGISLKPKYQAGFMGGADVEYRIDKGLGITLGAYYARQGMRFPDCELTENAEKGEYTGIKNHHVNLDYIQVPLMLKAYLVEGLSVNAGVQVGFLCGDGKVKREETDIQKDKNGSVTYKNMQETEALWPAKKVDVAIPLGLSYEYMNVILDARYNVSLTKAGKGDWDNCKNKALTFTVGYRFTL